MPSKLNWLVVVLLKDNSFIIVLQLLMQDKINDDIIGALMGLGKKRWLRWKGDFLFFLKGEKEMDWYDKKRKGDESLLNKSNLPIRMKKKKIPTMNYTKWNIVMYEIDHKEAIGNTHRENLMILMNLNFGWNDNGWKFKFKEIVHYMDKIYHTWNQLYGWNWQDGWYEWHGWNLAILPKVST